MNEGAAGPRRNQGPTHASHYFNSVIFVLSWNSGVSIVQK